MISTTIGKKVSQASPASRLGLAGVRNEQPDQLGLIALINQVVICAADRSATCWRTLRGFADTILNHEDLVERGKLGNLGT